MDKFVSITWWRQVFQKSSAGFGWGCAVVFALPLVIGFSWNQFSGRNSQNSGPANRDATLMTVNGDPVSMADYYMVAGATQPGAPGKEYATKVGQSIKQLVEQTIVQQEAKREGVKASDAEVDKKIQDLKVQQLGKNATDADMETLLYNARHLTLADYREMLSKGMLGQALVEAAKQKTVVTEEEARNQAAEVRLNVVLIPTLAAPTPGARPDPRSLPDAEAQKKAEALLAEARTGKPDIAALARANSSDYTSKKGGDTDFMPEYKSQYASMGLPESMTAGLGVLGFGKDFDDAVHKTKVGDFTGVVKATGFRSGYVFAKVADRHINLPKDFAPQKVVDQLKEARAQEAVTKKIEDLTKTAKVVFPADRLEQKADYDYVQLEEMQNGGAFGGPSTTSPDKIKAQQALVDSEIAAVYKKDPTNTTAAILVLESVQKKMNDRSTPPAEQAQLRAQLLPLYQSIIKMSEGPDYAYRFGLGDALRDNKQFAEAYKNYHSVTRMLDLDAPTDLKSMQTTAAIRQRLALALRSIASPEAPEADAEATAQTVKVSELNAQIAAEQAKQAAEQKLQEEASKARAAQQKKEAEMLKAHPPKTGTGAVPATAGSVGSMLNLGPGSSQSITVPPSGSPAQTGGPVPGPGVPAPSGKPTTPPTAGGSGR